MSNNKTTIELFATLIAGTTNSFLVAEVSYSKGGTNWFHGGHSPRGYRVSVHDETRERGSISFMIDGNPVGRTVMLEETKMFSRKKLEALASDPAVLVKARSLETDALARWHAKEAQRLRDYPDSEPKIKVAAENTILA